jgi:hypothetical protein
MKTKRMRSVGGLVGVAVAVAGGFGAAVGLYSLPDPQSLGGDGGVYARLDERGIAVWNHHDESTGVTTQLRIDVSRGGSAGEDLGVSAEDWPRLDGRQDLNVSFLAVRRTCWTEDQCNEQYWNEQVPSVWFVVDALMNQASFHGAVEGCQFDIEWTGEGVIAPWAGYEHSDAWLGPWNAGMHLQNAFGELSRVAPAQISMSPGEWDGCQPWSSGDPAPGYLSRGLRRGLAHGFAELDPPEGGGQ